MSQPPPAFGFLTLIEHADWGITGGYLVVNAGGRPMEFHCTAPVKPTRAQEILYGASLRPFLHGEQIGQALTNKAKVEALAIFTDQTGTLELREFIGTPVVLVPAAGEQPAEVDVVELLLENRRVYVPRRHASDNERVQQAWRQHGHSLDLLEPFSRIRNALEEAQKSARPAA